MPVSNGHITPLRQLWHFLVHLRWHYQVGILSGGYLLGGVLADAMQWETYLLQYGNVHLLLFGGATAYNSYWDRDEGPVGGLRRPPPMRRWMLPASLALQFAGWILAWSAGIPFALAYGGSLLLFWLYSTPHARWKASPHKSLVAIGLATGAGSMLMGYFAASPYVTDWRVAGPAALGTALVVLSLYPLSQAYQLEEDRRRGDRTFAMTYGPSGVRRFFLGAFLSGIGLVFGALLLLHPEAAWIFLLGGVAGAAAIRAAVKPVIFGREGYRTVMNIKYGTSLLFVCLLAAALLFKHGPFS